MSAAAADSKQFPSQTEIHPRDKLPSGSSYYGMKGILALYITNALLKDKDYATNVIHLFGFVNYFMPLLGAWVSDRFWGLPDNSMDLAVLLRRPWRARDERRV